MYKYKTLLVVLTTLCSLIPAFLYSQSVDTAWVRRYNTPALYSDDRATSLAVDGQGNVYVTGYSNGLGSSYDYATIKYNSAGVQQWVQRYNGPLGYGDDGATSLAVDGQGNVYVTGTSIGSPTNNDYATIKYNSTGVQQWIARYNGPGNWEDDATSLAVDGQGNVYITGQSASYDSTCDYATIKYNIAGVQQWVARYDGPMVDYDDGANSLAVDGQGNVYVTGWSFGSITTSVDYATIKYNSAGVQQWIQRYNGLANGYDYARAIAVDGSGNVYVTGQSDGSGTDEDYATIKYNSSGVQQWVARYNGPGIDYHYDYAHSLAVDGQGNVYVTGESRGSGTYQDYATIKYNSAGVQQWVQRYNGPAGTGDGCAYALAVDGQSNVYVTGSSAGSGTWTDYATIKYNSAGVQQWIQRYNGPGNREDGANSLAVDGQGNVYVTGGSTGNGSNGYDYATIKYVQTGAIEENHSLLSADRFSFEVYPNPAKTFFTVRSPFNAQGSMLRIFDVTGKVVKEFRSDVASASSTLRVTLDGIMNGIYFIKVGNEMVKEKLVVTR